MRGCVAVPANDSHISDNVGGGGGVVCSVPCFFYALLKLHECLYKGTRTIYAYGKVIRLMLDECNKFVTCRSMDVYKSVLLVFQILIGSTTSLR